MRTLALLLILALAGCRKDEPQAPTAEQSAQLNEAEDLLTGMDRPAAGPADRTPGPTKASD
jgi:hypothetical protein